ncbi:MAG: protein GlxC [Pseudomonadota bacterium]
MTSFDLQDGVRALNAHLHGAVDGALTAINPAGRHAVAVGATAAHEVTIEGNVGYYCGGMNQHANLDIRGSAGPGLAENMMSGRVTVRGDASQYCGATAHGGLVVVEGNASSRCGISMKGVNIVVRGNVGHMSAFMAQKGCLLVCGDAGDALGDSLYEARLYVRGSVASLGADCTEKPMAAEHLEEVQQLLADAAISDIQPSEFRRYGSARKLYHFDIDNASDY